MNNRIKERFAHLIRAYMQYMDKDAAVAKIKRIELHRHDALIDAVAAQI